MLSIHPNEGVVFFGIVQIILGLGLVLMTFFQHKYQGFQEAQNKSQKYLLLFAGVIVTAMYLIVDMYLELPTAELSSKVMLKSIIGFMGTVGLFSTFAIEGSRLDKRVQKRTLFTFLTGKKNPTSTFV
jgi:fluoride ion exporter CrcB/FEX